MSNKNINDYIVDKRKYFRIDDQVYLDINIVGNISDQDKLFDYYENKLKLINESTDSNEDKIDASIVNIVKNKYPDIYEYISYLENKITDLEKKINNPEEHEEIVSEKYQINISASGMAFVSSRKYRVEDILDIVITLYPSLEKIYLLAKVLRVKTISLNKINIAVEFIVIDKFYKDILIKHIHKKQMGMLHH